MSVKEGSAPVPRAAWPGRRRPLGGVVREKQAQAALARAGAAGTSASIIDAAFASAMARQKRAQRVDHRQGQRLPARADSVRRSIRPSHCSRVGLQRERQANEMHDVTEVARNAGAARRLAAPPIRSPPCPGLTASSANAPPAFRRDSSSEISVVLPVFHWLVSSVI